MSSPPAPPRRRYTRKEIESRNHKHDAVIIIDNRVFDVTKFLEDHPGGHEVLLTNAGRDASKCFHDIGHTEDARKWMLTWEIGDVVDEDRQELYRKATSDGSEPEPVTLASFVSAMLPPLLLAVAAFFLYSFLFA